MKDIKFLGSTFKQYGRRSKDNHFHFYARLNEGEVSIEVYLMRDIDGNVVKTIISGMDGVDYIGEPIEVEGDFFDLKNEE